MKPISEATIERAARALAAERYSVLGYAPRWEKMPEQDREACLTDARIVAEIIARDEESA